MRANRVGHLVLPMLSTDGHVIGRATVHFCVIASLRSPPPRATTTPVFVAAASSVALQRLIGTVHTNGVESKSTAVIAHADAIDDALPPTPRRASGIQVARELCKETRSVYVGHRGSGALGAFGPTGRLAVSGVERVSSRTPQSHGVG
jgi:hypothetical protein